MRSSSLTVACSSTFSEGEKIKLVERNEDMEKWIRGDEALWIRRRNQNLENYGNDITTIKCYSLFVEMSQFSLQETLIVLESRVLTRGAWWHLLANVLDIRTAIAYLSSRATGHSLGDPGRRYQVRGRGAGLGRRRPATLVFVPSRPKRGSMPNPGRPYVPGQV